MTRCDGKKKKTHEAAKSTWMAPAAWESRCKLIIVLAIEIIVGLGTFSFKDQPIKARLEVFASFSYEFAELECKHYTLHIIKRIACIMQKCKSTSSCEFSREIPSCMRDFSFSPTRAPLERPLFSKDLTRRFRVKSRNYVLLRTDWNRRDNDRIIISDERDRIQRSRLQKRFLIERIIISLAKYMDFIVHFRFAIR